MSKRCCLVNIMHGRLQIQANIGASRWWPSQPTATATNGDRSVRFLWSKERRKNCFIDITSSGDAATDRYLCIAYTNTSIEKSPERTMTLTDWQSLSQRMRGDILTDRRHHSKTHSGSKSPTIDIQSCRDRQAFRRTLMDHSHQYQYMYTNTAYRNPQQREGEE